MNSGHMLRRNDAPHRAGPGMLRNRDGHCGEVGWLWEGGTMFSVACARGGVYRAEVYLKNPFFGWRPCIFSNPLYLR